MPHESDNAPPTLLDAKDLAEALGCSTRHLYKLQSTGQLPAPVRIGRLRRWPAHVIRAWLAAGGSAAPASR